MRKRKSVKKGDESEGSEHGGEPEEFQDSGEDWTPDADSVSTIYTLIVVLKCLLSFYSNAIYDVSSVNYSNDTLSYFHPRPKNML